MEHVTGISDLEKPVYIGRSFTDDDTGEIGHIVEITDTEVKIEFEKEYWTYEVNDFVVDNEFADILESIRDRLSSSDNNKWSRAIHGDIEI